MGYYINPPNMTKEEFLLMYGELISLAEVKKQIKEGVINFSSGRLPVCLIDNGPFTAAAIAYEEGEIYAFSQPDDYRPKIWFLVDKELLNPYLKY